MSRYFVQVSVEGHPNTLGIYVAAADAGQAQTAAFDAYTGADMVVTNLDVHSVERFPEDFPVLNAIS